MVKLHWDLKNHQTTEKFPWNMLVKKYGKAWKEYDEDLCNILC